MVTRSSSAAQAAKKATPKAASKTARKAPARRAPASATSTAITPEASAGPALGSAAPVKTGRTTAADKDTKADKASKAGKPADKPKKPKLVRDSFTIPKPEYEVIAQLKLRAAKLGQTPKKSELLRAGIKALAAMNDAALVASLASVPPVKTGRPAA